MNFYFAYGSNLNQKQMASRCPGSNPIGNAILNGYLLSFSGHSSRWGGAPATIIPGEGEVTGALYQVSEENIHQLDQFERVPINYHHEFVEVRDSQGEKIKAMTYIMNEYEASCPSPLYVKAILEGLNDFGISEDCLTHSLLRHKYLGNAVFVYGTLMEGLRNHHFLEGFLSKKEGAIKGILYDMPAGYPVLKKGDSKVYGEIYFFDRDFSSVLEKLDQLEGYFGPQKQENEYIREISLVRTPEENYSAWVYSLGPSLHPDLASGKIWNGGKWIKW